MLIVTGQASHDDRWAGHRMVLCPTPPTPSATENPNARSRPVADKLFATRGSHRDRALLAFYVHSERAAIPGLSLWLARRPIPGPRGRAASGSGSFCPAPHESGKHRWLKVADAHFADARAAAGTRWLAGLTITAGQLITGLQPGATDPVDAAAISGIAASRLRTMPGTKFAAVVQAVTGGLAQTSAPQYEEALAGLGQLAGAAVAGRCSDDAEPDAVWMFSQQLWAAFEAKSECKPAGRVSADTTRQAGGHLNYAADSAGEAAPPGSFAVIISPQQDVHRAAAAVAGDRVYLVAPEVISDIAARLVSAWDSIRIHTRTLGPAEAEPVIIQILRARRALPSQWLPSLTARRVADG